MGEPEEILIEAAHRATAATRALWQARRRAPDDETQAQPTAGVELAGLRAGLGVLLRACFAVEPELVASDPAPAPGWLARRFGRLAPWQRRPVAQAFTDGERIFLPRRVAQEVPASEAHARLRACALGLAARIVRGSLLHCPREPLARDLFWSVDAAWTEEWLTRELPGLAAELACLRRAALGLRPAWTALAEPERRVEGLVRELLAHGPEATAPCAFPGQEDAAARDPAALAAWAQGRAASLAARAGAGGGYRGMAPVAHWGIPRPDLVAGARAARGAARGRAVEPARDASRRVRSRRLLRRLETRRAEEEEQDARPAPILLASEEGQLATQDPAGLRRPRDRGLDEPLDLDALAEELARQPQVARTREAGPVAEVLESEEDASWADAPERTPRAPGPAESLLYPEWDARRGAYRPSWCVVRETPAPDGDPHWAARVRREHAALFGRTRRLFQALRPRREHQRRRPEGVELDLDALVADHADRRAGLAGSERIYRQERPNRRDLCVSFLVDASGSTDAWLGPGRCVLDVAKIATLALGEALRLLGDRHAIHAFSGEGPRDVRVLRVKGFREPAHLAPRRIAGLAPDRYTRLGAPLRHLCAGLAAEPGRRRLLLLLSDGKPNDEDEYEGRHGVEDTRQAIMEARLQGIEAFCLTLDRDGSAYLPRMFGPRGYAVLADPRQLPERLVELYRRLTLRA